MSNLNFKVELNLATQQFNQAVNQVMAKTQSMNSKLVQTMNEISDNSAQATNAIASLMSADPKTLVNSLNHATKTLNGLGAGANVNMGQLNKAMQSVSEQVANMSKELSHANDKLAQLKAIKAPADEIAKTNNKIKELSQAIGEAKKSQESFAQSVTGAMGRVQSSTQSAKNNIYALLNVKSENAISKEINEIQAEIKSLARTGAVSSKELERLTAIAQKRIRELSGELGQVGQATRAVSGDVVGLGGVFSGLAGVIGALALGEKYRELVQLAEAFNALEAQVKIATGGGVDFVTAMDGIKQVANETFTSLEQTATLFSRLSVAGKEMGMRQRELLDLTKVIGQAMQLSGGSAESANAALTQLIQGLGSGVLRGEEFNSVMEQSPRLARALADGLGVGIGQLRAMAGEGKLTADVVIKALQTQANVIEKEFAEMPTTVDNSLQVLKNNFLTVVGEIDGQLKQSNAISDFVMAIAKGLESIDPTTIEAVKVFFSQLGELAKTLWQNVQMLSDDLAQLWGVFDGTTQAGEKLSLLTHAMQTLSVMIAGANDGVKILSVGFNGFFGAVLGALGFVIDGFETLFGLSSRTGVQMMEMSKQMTERFVAGALEFESQTLKTMANNNKTRQTLLNEQAHDSQVAYEKMANDFTVSNDEIKKAHLEAIKAQITANGNVVNATHERALAEHGLQAVISKTGELSLEQHKVLGENFAQTAMHAKNMGMSFEKALDLQLASAKSVQDIGNIESSLHALYQAGEITGVQMANAFTATKNSLNLVHTENDKLIQSFSDYAQKVVSSGDTMKIKNLEQEASLRGLNFVMQENGAFMVSLAQTASTSANTISREFQIAGKSLSLDMDKALLGVSKGFTESITSVQVLIDGYDKLGSQGVDAEALIVQALTSMSNNAKNTAELEQLTFMWQRLGDDGKITGEKLQAGLGGTRNKLDELTDGINSTTEAYKILGLQSKADLQAKAQQFKTAYEMIKESGTATADTLEQAFKKYAQASILANDGVADSAIKAQANHHKLAVSVDKSGKATITNQTELKKAVDNVGASMDDVASRASRAGAVMSSSADSAKSSWDSVSDSVQNAVQSASEAQEGTKTTNGGGGSTTQFHTATGIENFLKQAGLGEETAMKYAQMLKPPKFANNAQYLNYQRELERKYGNGRGFGGMLLNIAEKHRHAKADKEQAQKGYGAINEQFNAMKTVNFNITQGGKTINANVPTCQENAMIELLKQLENSKALSGK